MQHENSSVPLIQNTGCIGLEAMHADVVCLEHDLPVRGQPRCDQVLHHLMLAVDYHVRGKRLDIDAVVLPADAQPDACVRPAVASVSLARDRCIIGHRRLEERRA